MKFGASLGSGILMGMGSVILKHSLSTNNALLIFFALVLGGIGVILFQYGLKHWKSSLVASVSMGSNTLMGVLGAVFLLGEHLSLYQIVGICMILIGIAISRIQLRR